MGLDCDLAITGVKYSQPEISKATFPPSTMASIVASHIHRSHLTRHDSTLYRPVTPQHERERVTGMFRIERAIRLLSSQVVMTANWCLIDA